MAFDLNKSNPAAPRFKLSKDDSVSAVEASKKKASYMIWVILVLMMIGGLMWYLLRDRSENSAAPLTAATDSPVVRETAGITGSTVTRREEPAVDNRIAGSFKPGSADVLPDEAFVNELLAEISKAPERKILIKGYASSEGDVNANKELSLQRANSFKAYLLRKGISADRITVEGKGIDDPLASNTTENGRRKNRRVQVSIDN